MTEAKKDAWPFTPGWAFKDGKCYHFESSGVTVMKAWPPQAWCKTTARPWWRNSRVFYSMQDVEHQVATLERLEQLLLLGHNRSCETDGQLCLPLDSLRVTRARKRAQQARDFMAAVPEPVLVAVKRFPKRQFHLLSFMARCEGAVDLVQVNPALAYMLASNWLFHRPPVKQPMRSARSLTLKKMPQILEWLGFPGTRGAARIVRKVRLSSCDERRLIWLQRAMQSPQVCRALAHVEAVNGNVIRVASDPRLMPSATTSLLSEMSLAGAEGEDTIGAAHLLRQCVAMARLCRKSGRLGRVKSISQLREMRREFRRRIGDGHDPSAFKGHLPKPPVLGKGPVRALDTPALVVREGAVQKNCAGSYLEQILNEQIYLYRLVSPQRCTVSLIKEKRGWQLGDIKASCNDSPSGAAIEAVHGWLGEQLPSALDHLEDESECGDEMIPF